MIIMNIGYGLGNQMFQYAFAKALSQIKGDKLLIPKSTFCSESGLRTFGLDRFKLIDNIDFVEKHFFINLKYRSAFLLTRVLNKFKLPGLKCFHVEIHDRKYHMVPYLQNKMNIYYGIFQSEKFFYQIRDELIDDFGLKNIRKEIVEFGNILRSEDSVCVHFRRGDYLKLERFQVYNDNYFHCAIEKVKDSIPQAKFYAFSDDIEWVKENFPDITPIDFTKDMYEDLYLMTKCRNFIISNSTFSWWGQYLSSNPDKIVIAPSRWMVGQNRAEDYIYQDNWVLIDAT